MLGRLFCCLVVCAASISFASTQVGPEGAAWEAALLETWKGSVFRIEDTKSRVSIASVKLSVSDLRPEGGNLVGEYSIRVPLMKSKNDHGKIILPLDCSMHELGANGGVLRGQSISYKEGTTPNAVVCEILPDDDQLILLDITTDDRTIKFKSRYTIVETTTDS